MSKLTLSVDATVVRLAKKYAARQGTSLSRLIERYLRLLARPGREGDEEPPPVLARLRGVLKGASGDEAEYRHYLERKYR